MGNEVLKRDLNRVTVIGAVTDDIDKEIFQVRGNPITKRLLIDNDALPANTDGVYIGDIKFGESLPAGTNYIGKVGLETGDIEIGAVEIKNATDDTRVVVKTDGTNNALVVTQNSVPTHAVTQSGDWSITDISGTISLPTDAATETTLNLIKTQTDLLGFVNTNQLKGTLYDSSGNEQFGFSVQPAVVNTNQQVITIKDDIGNAVDSAAYADGSRVFTGMRGLFTMSPTWVYDGTNHEMAPAISNATLTHALAVGITDGTTLNSFDVTSGGLKMTLIGQGSTRGANIKSSGTDASDNADNQLVVAGMSYGFDRVASNWNRLTIDQDLAGGKSVTFRNGLQVDGVILGLDEDGDLDLNKMRVDDDSIPEGDNHTVVINLNYVKDGDVWVPMTQPATV